MGYPEPNSNPPGYNQPPGPPPGKGAYAQPFVAPQMQQQQPYPVQPYYPPPPQMQGYSGQQQQQGFMAANGQGYPGQQQPQVIYVQQPQMSSGNNGASTAALGATGAAAGPAESGKSTILKQMTLIYGTGFTDTQTREYREAIQDNLLVAIATLIKAMDVLMIPFGF
ncbi:UNVERIFIED_CONTAM: Guanine nucleotide-binding protein subunit alpha-15, partial [Siphonaria sp. JEL0065]